MEAAKLYRQVIKDDKKNYHALHFLGVTEAETGNFKQAKRLMARSLSIQPPNVQFIENYATVLFQAGDYEAALIYARRGLRLNDNSITLTDERARVIQTRQVSKSVAQFDRLLLIQPNHVAAHNERGSVLAMMKQYDRHLPASKMRSRSIRAPPRRF